MIKKRPLRNSIILFFLLLFIESIDMKAQSVARDWNEELLSAIRIDYARPTNHSRNLFHSSVLMYDAWAVFDTTAETYFLGKTVGGYTCVFNGIATPTNINVARHEVMSFAMFRLLRHRFQNSPGAATTYASLNTLFTSFGYDPNFTSTDYSTGSYAALGNYMANEMILFGFQDGSEELNGYQNQYYTPVNPPLVLGTYTDTNPIDPNHWQPLEFDLFVDQSGNPTPGFTPPFLGPEWGKVIPFGLKPADLQIINNGFDWYVYNDPTAPPYIQNSNENGIDDPYKWYFTLVASWSSHLDPADPTIIDISPKSIGNIDSQNFPTNFTEFKAFYDFTNGGDSGTGHALNPYTNAPYAEQLVKRSDYARVLAEFWADGPNSETPPGHWFTLLNYINDNPLLIKKFAGTGPVLSDLEWDVKSYFALGGAMHDSAVDTWGIKGYYDYVRPISALHYMAGKGQSSDATLPSYDPHGLPLVPGLIELVTAGDPLAGASNENVNKLKVYAWKGPDFIADPLVDIAGVDWILMSHWWPYQRPTFVTPPFAGYVSGHSTFSRAGAEVLTMLTGDPYFPGGMGVFDALQNEFLVFEEGPTQTIELQWATYRDASDQCSLSRIWGGIHPPIDDIPGRIIGEKIGIEAFNLAAQYFNGSILDVNDYNYLDTVSMYPIPFNNELKIKLLENNTITVQFYDIKGTLLIQKKNTGQEKELKINTEGLASGVYFVKLMHQNEVFKVKKVIKN